MSSIAANDDSPDDDEYAHSQQQMNPSWAVENERADCPDHKHRNADN